MPYYASMGELISTQRKKKNLTQVQLAQKLGVTDKAVSKWERDLSYPDTAILIKLSEVFDISVSELVRLKVGNPVSAGSGMDFSIFDIILEVIIVDLGVCSALLCGMKVIEESTGLAMLGFAVLCIGVLLIKRGVVPKE